MKGRYGFLRHREIASVSGTWCGTWPPALKAAFSGSGSGSRRDIGEEFCRLSVLDEPPGPGSLGAIRRIERFVDVQNALLLGSRKGAARGGNTTHASITHSARTTPESWRAKQHTRVVAEPAHTRNSCPMTEWVRPRRFPLSL